MDNKYFYFGAGLASLLLAIIVFVDFDRGYLVSRSLSKNVHQEDTLLEPDSAEKLLTRVKSASLEAPNNIESPNEPSANQNSKAETNTVPLENLWSLSPTAKQELNQLGYVPPTIAEEVYIDVDIKKFKSLTSDQEFEIEIPQLGEHFIAKVSDNIEGDQGIRTLTGTIDSKDRTLNVLISYSDDSIIGEISTPTGDYLIEGTEQYAWLAPRQAMAANTRPDVEITDVLKANPRSEKVPTNLPLTL